MGPGYGGLFEHEYMMFFSHIFQIESFQPRSKKKSKCQSNRFFISSTHIFSSDRLISCRATSASLNSIRSFNISIFIRAKWVFFASFFLISFIGMKLLTKKTQKLEEVWNERFHEVKLIEFLISIVFFFCWFHSRTYITYLMRRKNSLRTRHNTVKPLPPKHHGLSLRPSMTAPKPTQMARLNRNYNNFDWLPLQAQLALCHAP